MSTSSMRFARDWRAVTHPMRGLVYRPLLPIYVRGRDRFIERDFLVDSGADLSMAPYELCREVGFRWQDGEPTAVQGVSRRKVCSVRARIFDVDMVVPDAGVMIRLPMLFAKGDAPYLLGRDGFFDLFTVTFDKTNLRTLFELSEP